MTKKIYYEKVGRKYVPVSEYDSDLTYALPKGTHLLMTYPGGTSTRYHINPNYAAMIAAGRICEDVISRAIVEATELRRNYKSRQTPLTPEQKAAWDHLVEVFGEDARQLEWPSAREIAEKAVEAMTREAEKLMTVPSVQKAYEHFMLMAELTRDNNDESES
jgi:hypothetical protein